MGDHLSMDFYPGKDGSIRIRVFNKELLPGLRRGLKKAATIIVAQIKTNLKGPSHVKFPNSGNPFPGTISGNLAGSIGLRPFESRDNPGVEFGANLSDSVSEHMIYARIQCLGGVAGNGAVIPPRPYIRPAFRTKQREAMKIIETEVFKPIRGA